MQKLIVILGFIIGTLNITNAQICDTINCSNIKDYVNARITQAYIVDLLKVKTKTSKEDSINYKKIEAVLNSNKLEAPLKYETLVKCLNDNNFGKTREYFTDPINSADIKVNQYVNKEEITDDILNQLLNKLAELRKTKVNQIPNLINNLKKELNTYITSKLVKPQTEPVAKPPLDVGEVGGGVDQAPIKVIDSPSFFSLSNFNFFTLLILLLLLIVFVVLGLRISNLNEIIDRMNNKMYVSKSGSQQVTNFPQKVEIPKPDFEKLLGNSEKFNDFYTKLERLEMSALNAGKQTQPTNSIQPQSPSNINAVNSDIFYMTKPVENYFPISAKSLSPSDTVYKFIIGKNNNFAEYEIHTQGAPIGEIIKRSETYIVPGCNEENNPSGNANKIVTKIKGQVQLEGDRWIIKLKATIRYE